jgi:hypothetical protein
MLVGVLVPMLVLTMAACSVHLKAERRASKKVEKSAVGTVGGSDETWVSWLVEKMAASMESLSAVNWADLRGPN